MTGLVVVGLGLIGGSVALAHRAGAPDSERVGIDVAAVIRSPAASAVVDRCIDAADREAVRSALAGAPLVVLAMPVGEIVRQVVEVLELADVVTDCGSTKRAVVQAASRSPRAKRFVPGHPMAGAPNGGLAQARADLFRDRRWLLCPDGKDADALARVQDLVQLVGAVPVRVGAAEHDRAVAVTSHVPQLLASAMCVLAERHHAGSAVGPAFERLTQGAGGGEAMWGDIFGSNADAVAAALRELCAELEQVATDLEREPEQASRALELLALARAALGSGA